MRAIAKTEAGPGLELIDAPEPEVGPGDVKIRVEMAGLCGTDVHIDKWDDWAAGVIKAPLIIGHEFYGEIVEVGPGVEHLTPGEKVSGEGHVVCGVCRNCRAGKPHACIRTSSVGVNRNGAFADYVVIPASNVWVHGPTITPELGAIFDPFGNATHTALQWPMVGEDVVVTGAGPIGIMGAAIARQAGARNVVITDVAPYRLELAKGSGADLVLDASKHTLRDAMEELGMCEGFDIGMEMSGNPHAMNDLIATMNHGGRVALLGLPSSGYDLNFGTIITRMITLKGIYGREMYDTWYAMNAMLESSEELRNRVAGTVTHKFAMEDFREAFDTAIAGECGKIVLTF